MKKFIVGIIFSLGIVMTSTAFGWSLSWESFTGMGK